MKKAIGIIAIIGGLCFTGVKIRERKSSKLLDVYIEHLNSYEQGFSAGKRYADFYHDNPGQKYAEIKEFLDKEYDKFKENFYKNFGN